MKQKLTLPRYPGGAVDEIRTRWSYEVDDTGLRLAWVIPASLILWAGLLTLFALLLERTSPAPPELSPAEIRIVELPPMAGLAPGATDEHRAQAPPKPKMESLKPKPHFKARRASLPDVTVHPSKPRPRKASSASLLRPAATGTAKKSTEVPASAGNQSAGGENRGTEINRGGAGTSGMGSDSSGARAIYAPQPVIPDDLREEAFQTVAIARFKVTYDGQVKVTLITPTESPQLNELLLETLQQWRFFPAMKSGVAIDSQFDLRIPISVQ